MLNLVSDWFHLDYNNLFSGWQDYNSDWVFGLQSTTDGGHLPHQSMKNNEPIQTVVECELSNDSTFSRLNDNSSSDNSNMYTYYSLPNDSSLVSFSHPESPHKRVDFRDWNKVVPEPKKPASKVEKTPPVKRTFPCPICNKLFATKSNLERHGIVHSDVKPFQCVECKRMFSRRIHLERHKFLHMDQRPFNCEVCQKGFTQKAHLEKHRITHLGVKPFECVLCKKSFARKESLNRHKARHTAEEQKEIAAAENKANNEARRVTDNNCTAKRKADDTVVNKSDTNRYSVVLKPPDRVQDVKGNTGKPDNINMKSDISEIVV